MNVENKDKLPYFAWKMELLSQAIKKYGKDKQIDMLIEECGELIVALQHLKRGRITWDKVAEEMADVKIMIHQFHTIDGISDAIHVHEINKLKRLEERLIEVDKNGN